jgi:putative SOS response-associated peptidase YedK
VPANALVRPFNARMPAILDSGDYAAWLDPGAEAPAGLRRLLRPYPAGDMEARPADAFVNNPRHEGPAAWGRRGRRAAGGRAEQRLSPED